MGIIRGTTREEMERAGLALPKKIFSCIYCSGQFGHDQIHKHQTLLCDKRPGSTVNGNPSRSQPASA